MTKKNTKSPENLLVFTTLKKTFSFIASHKGNLCKISFAPTVFCFMSLVLRMMTENNFNPLSSTPPVRFFYQDITLMNLGLGVLAFFFAIVSFVTLTIADFRYILVQDHRPNEWVQMTWNRRHWRLIGYHILYHLVFYGMSALFCMGGLLVLFAGGISFSFGILSAEEFLPSLQNSLFILSSLGIYATIGIGIIGYVLLRLTLYTPAIAMDDQTPFTTSWRATKGNVWRLLGLLLLIAFVVLICYVGLKLLLLPILSVFGLFSSFLATHFVTPMFQAFFFAFSVAVGASLQSILYQTLATSSAKVHVLSREKP